MGFTDARFRVVQALRSGLYQHEERKTLMPDGSSPNLLRDDAISEAEVEELLLRFCNGDGYETSRHHQLPCHVHIFKPRRGDERWYVKTYFMSDMRELSEGEADVMFISVHPSSTGG